MGTLKKKLLQDSLTSTENTSKSKTQKKWLKIAPIVMCGMMGTMFLGGTSASAHGYIENSRAHYGKLEGLNWHDATVKYGDAADTPQGVEGYDGFPMKGPVDGKIASGGLIGYAPLDVQNPFQWKKVDIKSGNNTFVWKYTAEHETASWSYYITKKGWDPTKPLTRDMLELIGTIDGEKKYPRDHPNGYAHNINVPADREGYHVILGVWDISNTDKSFYQVMDVNVKNDGGEVDTEAPTVPTDLQAEAETTKINLKWTASTDNVGVSHYNVYRDGEKLAPVTGIELEDMNLKADTEYVYEVSAVDRAGNESEKSAPLTVKTKKAPEVDTEAPTAPTGLHSMGQTATTVDLMWTASTDNVGVDHYEIYRDGKRVHAKVFATEIKDSGLQPNTTYTYTVKAVDAAGNVSKASNTLNVKTKEGSPEGTTTWDTNEVYNIGDRIMFNGNEYEAKYWTKGDRPDISDAWKLLGDEAVEWNEQKPYQGGEKVKYQGVTYKAKWWTQGDIPGQASVWEKIQ
ncbi:hypothetical protein COD67_14580 [Bacillus cereus]|nr:hypothetical protein COI89_05905 [Bacillus cereus]PGU65985.1 hypothetical protein COD67_14580 [Bacillus cereus]